MQRARVFVYVCEMYVDGLCEGLEGKCSRLLSLRSCQSWVDRNERSARARVREKTPHALFHTCRSVQGGGAACSHTAPRRSLAGIAGVVQPDADFGPCGSDFKSLKDSNNNARLRQFITETGFTEEWTHPGSSSVLPQPLKADRKKEKRKCKNIFSSPHTDEMVI